MKCIDCEFYMLPGRDLPKLAEPGCSEDGDITNPNKNINCVAGGDKELLEIMHLLVQGCGKMYYRACNSSYEWLKNKAKQTTEIEDVNCENCRRTNIYKALIKENRNDI